MGLLTSTDIIVSCIFAFMLLVVASVQARALKLGTGLPLLFAAAVVFSAYSRFVLEVDASSDAVQYYISSIIGVDFALGTDAISWLTGIFSVTLNLGFLPTMIGFSIFGLLATQVVYATFLRLGGDRIPVAGRALFLVMLLTSVTFWGSGISKDGVALLGIGLFCWALTREGKRVLLLVLAVGVTTLARPHIGLMMIAALGIGILAGRDSKPTERFVVTIAGTFTATVLVPLILVYAGLDSLVSLDEIRENVEMRTQSYAESGGYVDISQLSLPMKLISYLFRPFPWEAGSAIQLAAAAQNLVLILGLILVLPALFKKQGWSRIIRTLSLLTFGIACLLFMSLTTANVGISTRQKWMAVVPLFFLLFGIWLRARDWRIAQAARRAEEAEGEAPARTGEALPSEAG